MIKTSEEQVKLYLNHLICWLDSNGWAGWDPYDIWDNKCGMWMSRRDNIFARIANVLMAYTEEFIPIILRKLFRVKPQVNAKAMGLFAAGFLQLEHVEDSARLIKRQPGYVPCFSWLEKNKVVRFGGCGWGYPFDWQSRILIPKNTPTVVNSAIIGDAYWLKYKYHGDQAALIQCEDICTFITNGLNRSGYKDDGSFCFSYTPVDKFQVHNANLFGAEYLIRIGTETKRDDWIEKGLAAANFSLSEIREDGTLNYWSNDQATGLQQDTYHSGFEIRCLNSIACLTGQKKIRDAADQYFQTWLKDYFLKDGTPCLFRGKFDILEVHSCAEALLCMAKMFETGQFTRELYVKHLQGILSATTKLWVKHSPMSGYFGSKKYKYLGCDIRANIPYIRWGQAWMLNALSEVQAVIKTL